MDENEKKEPETAQEPPKPENYSRYMGTLNRIYRRNNNPKKKRLGDGITSLKQEQKPTAPAKPENGKKDHSFLITLAVSIAIILILWVIKMF
jgi:hypothetical protein